MTYGVCVCVILISADAFSFGCAVTGPLQFLRHWGALPTSTSRMFVLVNSDVSICLLQMGELDLGLSANVADNPEGNCSAEMDSSRQTDGEDRNVEPQRMG